MKIFLSVLLVALLATVFVSAQQFGFRARAPVAPGKRYVKPMPAPAEITGWRYTHPTVESDKFFKSLLKVVKQVGKGAIKSYVNQHFDAEVESDYRPTVNTTVTTPKRKGLNKFRKLYKLYKLAKKLRKQRKEKEQSDKFFKKLFKVVKQVGKGAIKSYVNQHFDEEVEADFKLGKLLKKVGKVGLKLGKAYLRTQGIPLEDAIVKRSVRRAGPRRHRGLKRERRHRRGQRKSPRGQRRQRRQSGRRGVRRHQRRAGPRRHFRRFPRQPRRRVQKTQADKFFKKLLKTVGQIGKGALKAYINQNF